MRQVYWEGFTYKTKQDAHPTGLDKTGWRRGERKSLWLTRPGKDRTTRIKIHTKSCVIKWMNKSKVSNPSDEKQNSWCDVVTRDPRITIARDFSGDYLWILVMVWSNREVSFSHTLVSHSTGFPSSVSSFLSWQPLWMTCSCLLVS